MENKFQKYRETHKEKIKEYAKKYREANKQKCNELTKKWRQEHPDYAKEYAKKKKMCNICNKEFGQIYFQKHKCV